MKDDILGVCRGQGWADAAVPGGEQWQRGRGGAPPQQRRQHHTQEQVQGDTATLLCKVSIMSSLSGVL